MLAKLCKRKQSAGASGFSEGGVTEDVVRGDTVLLSEDGEQFPKGCELGFGGGSLFKVSDDANANSAGVIESVSGVSTMELLFPAKGGFDGTIGHSVAVSDYEMVCDAFPGVAMSVFSAKVLLMDGLQTSGWSAGVMQDDVVPGFRGDSRWVCCR